MKFIYGKNILITGGSSGIGECCAHLLAQHGYRVYAAARSYGREVKKFESGGEIIPVVMDVCSDESVKAAINKIMSECENIGVVIHCAGMGIAGAAEDTPMDEAYRQMDVNYFGVLRVNQYILPIMRKQGYGLVIITGSVAGVIPIPFQSHYSSSKFALEAYSRALRLETEKYGIKVTLIEPGDTNTGFTDARKYTIPEGSCYEEDCKRAVAKMEEDERNGASPLSAADTYLKVKNNKNL